MNRLPEQYMQMAISEAIKGQGRTSPNPPVGAVVVRDGEVVGRGYHPGAGKPHAEIYALTEASGQASGSDLYVTLEPCCHTGRTGPCTDAIIEAGVARVFVGVQDPNPEVSGRGMKQLREAGLVVNENVCSDDCAELIAPFDKQFDSGLPYIVYKAAVTLDGQTATMSGDSKWISSEESRLLVHQMRNRVDAIIVGAGTVRADNPKLTTRFTEEGRDAARVVIDRSLSTSPQAQIYTQKSTALTYLVTEAGHPSHQLAPYSASGTIIIEVDSDERGLDLRAAMQELVRRDLHHVMLEGGGTIAAAMLERGLIDRCMFFVSPKVLGGRGQGLFSGVAAEKICHAMQLTKLRARPVGTDILVEGEVPNVHRPD